MTIGIIELIQMSFNSCHSLHPMETSALHPVQWVYQDGCPMASLITPHQQSRGIGQWFEVVRHQTIEKSFSAKSSNHSQVFLVAAQIVPI